MREVSTYEMIRKYDLTDINSKGYLLKHKKTGARIALIENDDENKVFHIGFKTPPSDSTGVAHIMEHSVLCGSKEFPVKDPFVELAKGSLNTFLNAMTYPDKTIYPAASCNDKDFHNLMHVYLDAVFYPNIYREDKIFKQEGWHYELENTDAPLTISGVVYNEMKGAFSSSEDVLEREIQNSLFPDTCYGKESGGDPEVIPELTYEQFLQFHRKYYHPSNSYLYLYGNMDMSSTLEWIDNEYLSKFERQNVDSAIEEQKGFDEIRYVRKEYSISEDEEEQDNTYLSYNIVLPSKPDNDLSIAFSVLDYALCSAPEAPIKKILTDKGIGKDVYSSYEDGILQPCFCFTASNANEADRDEFVRTIEAELKRICEEGLNEKFLLAGLNYYEFKYCEADFGTYPRGLIYGLNCLDSWLYDDNRPFDNVMAKDSYTRLRNKVGTDYFTDLIRNTILHNQHKSVVVLAPKCGLTGIRDHELEEKLAVYKQTLSLSELEKLVKEAEELAGYQESPDPPEALATIPLLVREDLNKDIMPVHNELSERNGTKFLLHDYFTGGIGYLNLMFDINHLPEELIPYLGLFKLVLGYMDTKHYTYGELNNEINITTGGIDIGVKGYTDYEDRNQYSLQLEVRVKYLYPELSKTFELLNEMLFHTVFTNRKRLLEIIAESESRMKKQMVSSGHILALSRAASYYSASAAISQKYSGIEFCRLVSDLENHFEERYDDLTHKFMQLAKCIFRKENLMVDYTSPSDSVGSLEEQLEIFKASFYTDEVKKETLTAVPVKKNEGFMTSSQVQYVCMAGNFRSKNLPYTGTLRALKGIMGYDYLWTNVRVKGGAYGCMSGFSRTGDAYFVSYRDPNLEKTIDIYEKAAEYLRSFQGDERKITQFIIGALSELDTPLNPMAKGRRSLEVYMSGLTAEILEKERAELLSLQEKDIHKMADYVDAFLNDRCLCVVGSEQKVASQKALFMTTEYLF